MNWGKGCVVFTANLGITFQVNLMKFLSGVVLVHYFLTFENKVYLALLLSFSNGFLVKYDKVRKQNFFILFPRYLKEVKSLLLF